MTDSRLLRRLASAGTLALLALLLCAPIAPIGACVPHPVASAGSRPNVVFILMDDLGYGDLGSYGAPDVRTPRIDSLAREGVRLTDNYASAPVCSPTRAAFVTGRYQARCGIERDLESPVKYANVGLPVAE